MSYEEVKFFQMFYELKLLTKNNISKFKISEGYKLIIMIMRKSSNKSR